MKAKVHLKVAAVGFFAILFAVASMPSIVFFTRTQFATDLYNGLKRGEIQVDSECNVSVPINTSFVEGIFMAAGFRLEIPKRFGDTVDFPLVVLCKALQILNVTQWPLLAPEDTSFLLSQPQLEKLFYLWSLVVQPLSNKNENCSLSVDLISNWTQSSSALLCLNWSWLSESQENADLALFGISVIFGSILLVMVSVSALSIESKRKFPHFVVAWYTMLCIVIPIYAEGVERLFKKEKVLCCGKETLFSALFETTSGCLHPIIYSFLSTAMIKNFTHTAAVFWAAVGIINVWLAVVMSKTSLFSEHKNKVHAFQAVTVWGLAALLALMPYVIEGENGYDNFLLCFGCPRTKDHPGYYFITLAQQIGMIIGGLFIVHLIYKLKVQNAIRKILLSEEASGQQPRSVRELSLVERRFFVFLLFVYAIGLLFVLNYVGYMYFRNGIDVSKLFCYFACLSLRSDENECLESGKSATDVIRNLLVVYLVAYRVATILSLCAIVAFFSAAKDFRQFWKKKFSKISFFCEKKGRAKESFATGENLAVGASKSPQLYERSNHRAKLLRSVAAEY